MDMNLESSWEARIFRELNKSRRLEALVMLRAKLLSSYPPSDNEIQKALTAAQWRELVSPRGSTSWAAIDNQQKEGLREYLTRLETADQLNRKKMRQAKKRGLPWYELRDQTQAAYLHAKEALKETLAECPLLGIGLFPPPEFSARYMRWLDFGDMPRLTEIERKRGRKLFGRGPFWQQEVLAFIEGILQKRFPTSRITESQAVPALD